VAALAKRGVSVWFPRVKDPARPCYRVLPLGGASGSNDPNAVLLEETENVRGRGVVRAHADGSVKLEPRGGR